MHGALYRRYCAARREGAVFDQRATGYSICRRSRPGSWPRFSSFCRARPPPKASSCCACRPRSWWRWRRCYWTVKAWFHRWTTETDVTNLRIVHKTGFIKRRTFEMSLDKVESVDVNQSILAASQLRRRDHPRRRRGQGNHQDHRLTAGVPQLHHRAIGAARNPWPCNKIRNKILLQVLPMPRRPRWIPPKSRSSQSCRTNGGIPTARWRRCTRSIRCG